MTGPAFTTRVAHLPRLPVPVLRVHPVVPPPHQHARLGGEGRHGGAGAGGIVRELRDTRGEKSGAVNQRQGVVDYLPTGYSAVLVDCQANVTAR